jgi:hypothetical protein
VEIFLLISGVIVEPSFLIQGNLRSVSISQVKVTYGKTISEASAKLCEKFSSPNYSPSSTSTPEDFAFSQYRHLR